MTTFGFTQNRGRAVSAPSRTQSTVRVILLGCGIASTLLYAATDFLGGMRYEGYSFASQAISELGAIGAPSKPFVDPLFMIYQLLALAFGVGVFLEAGNRNRRLRITGAMLIAYGAIGLSTTFIADSVSFAMHERGTGSLSTDAPHIILTGVLVLFLLLAIGFGAFAFGKAFRIYSFATLVTVIAFIALTVPYAPQIAAGEPTPGAGIIERINVYSAFLWIAVLSVALLRPAMNRGMRSLP